jgi:hypothetical protein
MVHASDHLVYRSVWGGDWRRNGRSKVRHTRTCGSSTYGVGAKSGGIDEHSLGHNQQLLTLPRRLRICHQEHIHPTRFREFDEYGPLRVDKGMLIDTLEHAGEG